MNTGSSGDSDTNWLFQSIRQSNQPVQSPDTVWLPQGQDQGGLTAQNAINQSILESHKIATADKNVFELFQMSKPFSLRRILGHFSEEKLSDYSKVC